MAGVISYATRILDKRKTIMPTYEYACEKCGLEFEFYQSMKDDALTSCPKEACAQKRWGKGKVKRAIGRGAGIIFKGSGFYQTDYRSEGYKEAAQKDKTASESPKKSESKTKSGDGKSKSDSKSKSSGGSSTKAKKD